MNENHVLLKVNVGQIYTIQLQTYKAIDNPALFSKK